MEQIIFTTPEQLDEIVQKAIKKILPDNREEKSQKVPDTCSVEQALSFLSENGYTLSKSRLYKMTANKILPFRYFGVFEFLKENADLKAEIMRLRRKYEPDAVENELKNKKCIF